jgi:hypothetical protein
VLLYKQMSNTLTVRLPEELAAWLEETARQTGVPRGRIICNELERARGAVEKPWMKFAGRVKGAGSLGVRKGFDGQRHPGAMDVKAKAAVR